jgi:hypothetical protein
MALTSSQVSIVNEMFVHTADENYIAARWCNAQRLHTDFFWLGTHALEKYMKAVLLYNDRSVKRYGHDVLRLYSTVHTIGKGLLPGTLKKPSDLTGVHWINRTAKEFLEHLALDGSPDNRYLSYGYSTRSQDVHMLDTMVYAVRRLICPLDDRLQLLGRPQSVNPPTYRRLLRTQLSYRPMRSGPLDDLIDGKGSDELRRAALNLNMPFAPDTYLHESLRAGSANRAPILVRRIFDELKSEDKEVVKDGIATAEWLLKNTQVAGDGKTRTGVALEIATALQAAQNVSKISSSS